MTTILDHVDTIVESLSAQGASKDLAPVSKGESIDASQVAVVAGPETWNRQSRGGAYLVTYDVLIWVQGRVHGEWESEEFQGYLAQYLELTDEIKSVIAKVRGVSEVVQEVPYSQDRLYQEGIFSAQITARFKGFK